MKRVVLPIFGALAGALLADGPGALAGLMIGGLTAAVWDLRRRVNALETRLQSQRPPARKDSPQPAAPAPSDASQKAAGEDLPVEDGVEPPAQPPPLPQIPPPAAGGDEAPFIMAPQALTSKAGERRRAVVEGLRRWALQGNLVVRIGVVVLFFGVAFLLKYAAERDLLPIELRLAGVFVFGLALVAVGWRLGRSNRIYGLVLQGGGVGVLYLTVFAAARLYHLLPGALSFAVMVALVAVSAALAILQDAPALAQFGAAGGFLAPVLMSTGSGNHVMLFGYYSLLNAGVLAIAWFKSWRGLNLLGFLFTFGIGSAWGLQYYRPRFFSTTEPYLLLHFALYATVSICFALRQAPRLKGLVDGTLVFGLPLVVFALQTGLVRDITYGTALSALAMGLFYTGAATLMWRRGPSYLRLLVEAFLAMGVVFGSLTIPLALDARWTAAAWSLEGAALVWVGLRQHRTPACLFGLLLQLGAAGAFALAPVRTAGAPPVVNGACLSGLMISAAGLLSALLLQRQTEKDGTRWMAAAAPVALGWGLIWWWGTGLQEIERQVPGPYETAARLVFSALSALVMAAVSRRLRWRHLALPLMGFPLVMLAVLAAQVDSRFWTHPFAGAALPGWVAILGTQYYLLWRCERDWPHLAVRLTHPVTAWLLLGLMAWEAVWWTRHLSGGGSAWGLAAWAATAAAGVGGLLRWGTRITWPIGRHRDLYLGTAALGVFLALVLWSILAAANGGDPSPLRYLPLINPMDLAQMLVLLVGVAWVWAGCRSHRPPLTANGWRVATAALPIIGFLWLNGVVARTVHHWAGVPFRVEPLAGSSLFQAAVSVLWGATALTVMVWANRAAHRGTWFVGAGLLALVVVKLFVVDLSGTGTVARIVSFLAVGGLMLAIGFFSPAPPGRGSE